MFRAKQGARRADWQRTRLRIRGTPLNPAANQSARRNGATRNKLPYPTQLRWAQA